MGNRITIAELNHTRMELIAIVNERFDRMIECLEKGSEYVTPPRERVIPLTVNPSIFKRQKPVAVLIGDERIPVTTWAGVLKAILTHINQFAVHHERLMYLRGKVAGRERMFLSETKEGMTKPIKIDEDLYVEAHFGSEGMMHVLVQRILNVTQFDYSNVYIILKS